MTLFGIKALLSFYLNLALIFWYPRPPNSVFCWCCGLCGLRNRKININWGGGGGGREITVSKTLQNRILQPSVSTLLSSIVAWTCFVKTEDSIIIGTGIFYVTLYSTKGLGSTDTLASVGPRPYIDVCYVLLHMYKLSCACFRACIARGKRRFAATPL